MNEEWCLYSCSKKNCDFVGMSYVVGFHNKLSLLSSQTTCILFIYDLHISSVDIVTLEFYVALCLVV